MHRRFGERLEAGLKKLQAAAESGRLKDEAVARERLGRMKAQNWRASHVFDVTIQRLDPPQGKARLRITWQRNSRFAQWTELADGCYLLRTNLTGVDPATLWKRYIQLTEAEWAFRRPRFARCPQRRTGDPPDLAPQGRPREGSHPGLLFGIRAVEGAGRPGTAAQRWSRGAGLGDAPRTVLEELAKIKSGDVVLPARPMHGGPERTVRLRCVTEPDDAQRVLLHRLGLTLPRRLRRLDQFDQM